MSDSDLKHETPLFPVVGGNREQLSDRALAGLLPKLKGFLAKRVSNPADVEDLAQEILLRIHKSAGQLSDETRINGWLWQIARNTVIDYYRRRANEIHTEVPEDIPHVADDKSVEEIVESWLAPMIEALPEPYREAVSLSELQGMPQAEVAEKLNISLSGAKSRIQRGRERLRQSLLECCRFEFDRSGRIVGYEKIGPDCVPDNC